LRKTKLWHFSCHNLRNIQKLELSTVLTLALTNLNAILAGGSRENKIVNYLTFSKRGNENINNFIIDIEKGIRSKQSS